ncbi:hypothetical protein AAU61_01140 [Desulfocarbo indianensis]|nr:hypothetical protein AAU61_01140 [Desulfocarbo indianensis]
MANDLGSARPLAWRLMRRDISAQYRQSVLGVLWVLLSPLATALVFIVLQSRNVLNLGETNIPYPVYAMMGTILWQLFSASFSAPLLAVTANQDILAKVNFPRESLMLAAAGRLVFELLVKMALLAAVMAVFRSPVSWGAFFSPLAMLALILLGLSLGLLITPVATLYKDISLALPHLTMLWFLVTPVVYPPPQSGWFGLIMKLNPVAPLLTAARDLATLGTLSDPWLCAGLCLGAILLLLLAWACFRIAMPILIERMNA